jgi:uncharacterized membrane protein
MEKNRLEAFSDGVLAIIITIMILELKIPHSSDWAALGEVLPQLLGYILSFVFIGIDWVNHHHMLQIVRHVTGGIMWANLNLLFWLSLIPFATGWMDENHFATHTVVVYATLLLLCGLAFTILQGRICAVHELTGPFSIAMQHLSRKGQISTACYAASIPLAFWDTRVSCGLFILVAFIWFIPERSIEQALNKD